MDAALEIENYIETKENSGALLITGQWGCGKSYIIRQVAETLNRRPICSSNYFVVWNSKC